MSRNLATFLVVILIAACTAGGTPGTPGTATTDPGAPPTTQTPAPGSTAVVPTGELTCWTAPTTGTPGPITFEDVTEEMGLVEPLIGMYGHTGAFGDPNGDGHPDLVFGTFADREIEDYQVRGADGPRPDQLLLSTPALELVDGWSNELGRTSGAVFADFDADGDEDLLLIRHAGRDGDLPVPSRFFENVDGTLTAHSEPLPADFRGRTPAVADFDGDGLLDVYVSEDNSGETGGLLLHNGGSLEFTDVTEGSGLEGILALSAAAGDLDGDGLPDLATSTAVFLNQGDLVFENVTPDDYAAVPVGEEDDAAGVAIGDLDKDGKPDLVVGQHYRATVEFDSEIPVRAFLNTDDGFQDVTEAAGLAPLPTLAPHVEIADIDNDSWPDIVTSASAEDGTAPAVYRNLGGEDLAFEVSSGLGSDQYWVGAPVVDIDRDGRLDVFAVEWEPSLPSLMFHNNGDSGHWLEVSIDEPGRGIGTLVTVSTEDGTQIGREEISAGGGYASGHLPVAHFGLGSETQVSVTIQHPDGSITELPGIVADQHLRWPQGCGTG
ncbi:MAG TPA: CRTAC1 family protein [Acidimicrobiia bacterium]